MERMPEKDGELESLLGINLDDLDALGLEDASFRPGGPVAPVTLEMRMAASARLARLQAQWDKGAPGDTPSGLPMIRGMDQMGVAERSLTYKATVSKLYDVSVPQIKECYDMICLGEIPDMGGIRTLAGSFLDIMEKDRNILLALCLYQSPTMADYLYRHALNMCLVSLATACASGYSRGQALEIGQGALLADVGMTMVPEAILLKAGKLTDQELGEIHRHPANSFALLEKVRGVSDYVLSAAYQHHERLTGAGYPKRRTGAQISQVARIVAIADTLCAMVHKRSHRDALTPHSALDKVLKMGQMNFLDAALVKNLVRFLSVYPVGTFVQTDGGRIGRVVAAHLDDPLNPIITILKGANGQPLPMKQLPQVDLAKDKNETIAKVADNDLFKFKVLDGF